MENKVDQDFSEHVYALEQTLTTCRESIHRVGIICMETIRNGGKIILFGNGGSAADAEHLAAEFTGKYQLHRKGLPALSLTSDSAAITSIGNDYGFDHIFERQVEALAQAGDLVIGISTSGNSANVNLGITKAKDCGCFTIGLTGKDGGNLKNLADETIIVPSATTSRIQEIHILIGHTWCNYVETGLFPQE